MGVLFEGANLKIKKINSVLKEYSIKDLEQCKEICQNAGIDVESVVKNIQPICFDNAVWAYIAGSAIAIKQNQKDAKKIAYYLGVGLDSFTTPGSVAEQRNVGLGHGNLASKLLDENTNCFCFLAGHESFAAAEGALAIAKYANKVRQTPLKVILNGLGKDAAYIISRINGFTYVKTEYNYEKHELKEIGRISFGTDENKNSVLVYGACDSFEGVAIMKKEKVDISITGNSTNPVRFTHPVAGIYKNWCFNNKKNYFSVASGGGTGRTLHPDNVGAGPASYGLTDIMGRMHADAQFAGSSSVPSHVDMMGFIGMGNNPIVGATVSLAVLIAQKLNS